MKRFSVFVVLFILFFLASTSLAEETPSYPAQIRFGSRTRTNQNDGKTWGYADYFIPINNNEKLLIFLNPKASITDQSTDEESLGLGARYLFKDEYILGFNIFGDTRYSNTGNRYQQVGAGIEFLSKWVDFRANNYYPITKKQFLGYSFGFAQRSLMRYSNYEEPLKGFDGEIGFLIPFISDYIETRLYAGGYYFESRLGQDIKGPRARLEIRPAPFLTITGEIRDDDVFGTDTYAGGYVTLPFEIGNLFKGKNPFEGTKEYFRFGKGPRHIKERMTDMVVRDIDIVAAKNKKQRKLYDAIFVNNSNTAAGDGSLSNPFRNLQAALNAARNGVAVFVFSGNNLYQGNFQVPPGVILQGGGYPYIEYQGRIYSIDGFGGGYPTIDGNGVGSVITIASNTEISGLIVQNSGGGVLGIGILAVDASNVYFHHNIVRNNQGGGIAAGSVFVAGNRNNIVISDNIFTNNGIAAGAPAILYGNGFANSVITVIVSNNIIDANNGSGIWAATAPAIPTAGINTIISGNTITNNVAQGVVISNDGGGPVIVDLGGGAFGGLGYNSIFNNGGFDLDDAGINAATITARNNWWGQSPPAGAQFNNINAASYTPWLTSRP